ALGVDDLRRVPLVAGVAVLGHAAGGGDHRGQPGGVVIAERQVGPGRGPGTDPAAALVVAVHGHRTVALGGRHQIPADVVAHRLAVPVGVDHADQPAAVVGDPGVGPLPVRVRHHRGAPGEVDVAGGP